MTKDLEKPATEPAPVERFVMLRHWDMPSANTFLIPAINAIVRELVGDGRGWLDPFANANSPAETTNDLNPNMPTDYHMDAVEFLRMYDDCSVQGILLDPPYSMRQILEVYDEYGDVLQITPVLRESARIVRVGGLVVSFGWNSNGVGDKRMFRTEAVHLIAHGGQHNDTIVTVQRKAIHQGTLF